MAFNMCWRMVFNVATKVRIRKATSSLSASLSTARFLASVVKRSFTFRQPTDNVDVMKTFSKALFMMVWLLKVLLGPVAGGGGFFLEPLFFFFSGGPVCPSPLSRNLGPLNLNFFCKGRWKNNRAPWWMGIS